MERRIQLLDPMKVVLGKFERTNLADFQQSALFDGGQFMEFSHRLSSSLSYLSYLRKLFRAQYTIFPSPMISDPLALCS